MNALVGRALQQAADSSSSSGLSDQDVLILVLLGVAALAVIIAGVSVAVRQSEEKAAAESELKRRLAPIIGTTRWLCDSGAVDLLYITDRQQLAAAWYGVRERSIGLETHIAVLTAGVARPEFAQSIDMLGRSVSGLRAALQSYVSVRLDDDADVATLEVARNSVTRHRQQLAAALVPVQRAAH